MKKIIKLCIYMFCTSLLFWCTRNMSPIETENIIDKDYLNNWPDSLTTTGIGYPDSLFPLPQQRAYALRKAKYNAADNLDSLIKLLPISKLYTINRLCLSDTSLQSKIYQYAKSYFKVYDARYMSDDTCRN